MGTNARSFSNCDLRQGEIMNLSITKTLTGGAALLVVALGLAPALAHAQEFGGGFAPPPRVAGSIWAGRENLQGFGFLAFGFNPNGQAAMADAETQKNNGHGRIATGTWSQNGTAVTIRFKDCVYSGQIKGDVLSGTAQFVTGRNQGLSWSFSVRLQPNQPAPVQAAPPAPVFAPPAPQDATPWNGSGR
jgi:hypothetical protein